MGQLQIASKSEFYTLSRAGKLGNRLIQFTWPEFRDRWIHQNTKYADERLPRKIGIRGTSATRLRVTGIYGVKRAMELACKHLPESETWLFDEALPPKLLTLSGEAMASDRHLYLRGTHERAHMRRIWDAENGPRPMGETQVFHLFGLEAWAMIKRHMDAPSYDCFQEILHDYNNPIIEFGCASRTVGILRWNTIFWEARTTY